MNSIEVRNMNAKVGDFTLNDINLSIPKGSITGLIGKNGAGKTTLFKTLNGTYLKTSGDILINGLNFSDSEKEIRNNLAIVYDVINYNPYAKVKLLKKIYKQNHPKFDSEYFDFLIDRFGIDVKKRLVNLSLGMQKKLMLILALSVRPTILLLDEPLIGIDPIDKQDLIKLIQQYMEDENNTIILSSHQVEDIQKIADYVIFLNDGQIMLFEDKEILLDSFRIVYSSDIAENSDLYINPVLDSMGISGLIRTENVSKINGITQQASLEQIFIHLCK
jgi:ABC-2 type transport system ATP-binding protein